MILSAFLTVVNLWAMTMVVTEPPNDFFMFSIAAWTSFSLFLSRALVASSRISSLGFLMKARARARRYFSPPEKDIPPEPQLASMPPSNSLTNSVAFVAARASLTSAVVAWGEPSWMFLRMLVLKRMGSY